LYNNIYYLQIPSDVLVKAIAVFVKSLGSSVDDVDEVVGQVFPGAGNSQQRSKLHSAIKYYINGTKEGFLSYKSAAKGNICSSILFKYCNNIIWHFVFQDALEKPKPKQSLTLAKSHLIKKNPKHFSLPQRQLKMIL